MNGIYIGNDKMLIKTVYGGMLTISWNDRSLMPILATTGGMEMPLTNYFLQAIPPGGTFVDIGTNIGYFTVMASMIVGPKGKVIGLEASPSVFPFVQENLEINWLSDRVHLYNYAAYSEKTTIDFHASAIFQGDSSIYVRPKSKLTTIQIPTIPIDEVLKDVPSVDFLKIDIEGGEYHAFLGMKESLASRKIKQISFEWNKLMLGEDAQKFEALLINLEQNGASFYSCRVTDITKIDFYPFGIIKFY